jgi:ABC-type multidrug transport system fused ATPase/permease subunit
MAGTIRENLEYGRTERASDSALEAAAEAANCLNFIRNMPEGFDSQVGESGVCLSGGQKQRIAIARTFLRDPRILLLDEATSNLDEESESAVLDAMNNLTHNRTTIIITHRVSTLRDVDYIAVLERGIVLDFGEANRIRDNSPYFHRLIANEKPAER